jgi:ketosteroid isomerase-like protein
MRKRFMLSEIADAICHTRFCICPRNVPLTRPTEISGGSMTFAKSNSVATTRWTIGIESVIFVLLGAMCVTAPARAQHSENEKAVWKLETTYWEDVKALDLESYKNLWHENFVGWPYSNSQPARKDHITDWIKAHTDKGATMVWYELEPADSVATENLVVTAYWLTSLWADKTGHGEPVTQRVTHTWIRTANGWRIISGMSATVPAN